MNVYKITYTGGYGGGLAIVAANSEEEAIDVFDEDNSYYLDKREVTCDITENIYTDVKEPCILEEEFYIE